MNRRNLLHLLAGSALAGTVPSHISKAGSLSEKTIRGLPAPKIKDIQVIATAPRGLRLVVVKVITDQDGLYGYGCGTFTQRADLVVPAVEKYLKPFLLGKPADRIDDTWQACYNSSYWRNGPVLNNAISGVDQALWDIKGRMAEMPVYQLLGGKCREAAACYTHVSGGEIPEIIDTAKKRIAEGFRYIRLQIGIPGMAAYGGSSRSQPLPSLHNARVFEPKAYILRSLQLLEAARKELGDEIELLHDVHERVTPPQAVQLAKDVEQFKLFFLEDLLSPEDIDYFRLVRKQCATPLAMGELFNSPHEWRPLITERLIDFIRIHLSQAGGLTPCRKIAALGELFGVHTAWHGPGDVSPVGHAANLALDLACYNFGVQEFSPFNQNEQEIFAGCPQLKNGYLYASEKPGWGIEVDEKLAAKFPFGYGEDTSNNLNGGWGIIRRLDGTIIKQ